MHTQCAPPATSAVASDQVVARKVVLHTVEYHSPTTAKNAAGAAHNMTLSGTAAICTEPQSRASPHIAAIHQTSARMLRIAPHHLAQIPSPAPLGVGNRLVSVSRSRSPLIAPAARTATANSISVPTMPFMIRSHQFTASLN